MQIPDRLLGAVCNARGKSLEVLEEAKARGDSEEEWKAFLLLNSLLLGHIRSDTTCSESLEERLALWWGGQWNALWALVAAVRPPTQQPRGAQDDRQRARRVHTLAAAREEGRALAAATSSRPAPRTVETLKKVKDLFPESASGTAVVDLGPASPPSEELREKVEEEVARLLRRPPKLTAPGLLGTRLEHLAACNDDPDTLKRLAKTTACLAFGEAPREVLQALKTGEVVALRKNESDDPEIRPLLVGAILRRLGLRALVRAKKAQLREAAGENQYGVGRSSGTQLLYKKLQVQSELRPDAVFIKVDVKAAFQKMERQPALAALAAERPDLKGTLQAWYGTGSTHLWRNGAGRFEEVVSQRGFDQGCPLAPTAFSVGQKTALDPFLVQLLVLDPKAKLYSYLDDTYLVVAKEFAVLALSCLQEALRPLGLELNPKKTFVWSPNGREALPQELRSHFVKTLPVLGARLLSPGDREETPLQLGGDGAGLGAGTRRLEKVWQQLWKLQKAGLAKQVAAALLKLTLARQANTTYSWTRLTTLR